MGPVVADTGAGETTVETDSYNRRDYIERVSLSLSFGNGITLKINLQLPQKRSSFTRVITRRQTGHDKLA